MNNKILAEMDFGTIIGESVAQTQTGSELLNKYKSHLMTNESTCALVNGFVKEASQHNYDNGVNVVLESVVDFINCNKTCWALASACESIMSNTNSYNYLNRNAARQVEQLLEMNEEDVIKYIKAGALKNIMYCDAFRNIAKQVFTDQPVVESTADFTVIHPISYVENVGDGHCFMIEGRVIKMLEDETIIESSLNEVSNTFKLVMGLLESNITSVDQHEISIKLTNAEYKIVEEGKVTRIGKDNTLTLTVEQLRDNNRLMVMATNGRQKAQVSKILESIALLAENYSKVVNMDNATIYITSNDKFLVIESGSNLYATLLKSNHNTGWTINENVVDALTFIKKQTNASLSERYKEIVETHIENVTIQEKAQIEQSLKDQTIQSYKERVAVLVEKFKNDPVKLAVLSKLAQELNEE